MRIGSVLHKRSLHQLFWGDVVLVVWLFRMASLATKRNRRACAWSQTATGEAVSASTQNPKLQYAPPGW
jgi:hypothetical protein